MSRISTLLAAPLTALAICASASTLGLAVNALRPGGIPLVAPLPFEQDCPEKLALPRGPLVDIERATRLAAAGRALLLDARPAEAFAAGHIPGARSLPFSFLSSVDARLAASLKRWPLLIVYCDSPRDRLAGLLAEELRQQGLTGVRVLSGGLPAYSDRRRGGKR